MTPKQINDLCGKPIWKCVRCNTLDNLHWWNGLSVAICESKECNDVWSEMCYQERIQQEAYEEYVKEIYGD